MPKKPAASKTPAPTAHVLNPKLTPRETRVLAATVPPGKDGKTALKK